nr:MAG TPA: hypothetical protein [Caudoviricetes sp.]
MRKTIAVKHILYCTKQYVPGDEVFINDPEFLQLLIDNKSVRIEDDEEVEEAVTENVIASEEATEVNTKTNTEDNVKSEEVSNEHVQKDNKPIGRKSR